MIYLSDPITTYLFLYIQINHEYTDIPKVFQTYIVKLLPQGSLCPKLLTILLSPTKKKKKKERENSSPYMKFTFKRGKHYSCSTCIIYSKVLTKYWTGTYLFLGVTKIAIRPIPLDNWFDKGICLRRLDSEFFSFQAEAVFIHTWGPPSVDIACQLTTSVALRYQFSIW